MKKTVVLSVVLSIALCGLLQAGQLSEGLDVFYRSEGGHSSYSYIQVHVDKEGEVNVEWKKRNREDIRQGHFKLNGDEMDCVAAVVQASDFFAEVTRLKREGKQSRVVDAPIERLRVEWRWKPSRNLLPMNGLMC